MPGQVVRLPKGVKAPHMGWNQLHIAQRHALLKGVREGAYVYFVHSYYAKPKNGADVVATTDYGRDLTAIVGRANVAGMQFHPEKSQQVGHRMLSNFVAWTKR